MASGVGTDKEKAIPRMRNSLFRKIYAMVALELERPPHFVAKNAGSVNALALNSSFKVQFVVACFAG
jgi:hypothetical protein